MATASSPGPMLLIFAPTDGFCGATLEILNTWSQLGLLSDVIWIDQSSDDQSGILICSEGRRDVVVADELAARNLTSIRTVSLIEVGSEEDVVTCPIGSEELVRHNRFRQLAAETHLPYSGGILAATTTGVAVPGRIFDAGFSFNFLVVPEDRVADDRVGAPISKEGLPGLAACALASVTGLWFWADDATVDSIQPGGGTLDPRIQLVRCYVRIADGGSSIDRIVDSSLNVNQNDGQWPLPHGVVPAPQFADDPVEIIGEVINGFSTRFSLRFIPRELPGVPPPTRLKLLDGLKLFAKTFWRILRRMPLQWVEHQQIQVTEAVLRFFTSRTFTEDSDVILTLRGHSLPGLSKEATGIERHREIARVQMPGSDVITPEPAIWAGFRSVACGLSDAGPFPDDLEPPVRGAARLLVTLPDLIAPDADGALAFRDDVLPGVEISTCDAFGASELKLMIVDALQVHHVASSDEAISAADTTDKSAESTEAPPIRADTGHDPSALSTLNASVLEAMKKDELYALMAKLDAWVCNKRRNQSFAWRVGATIGDAISSASNELADALSTIRSGKPSVDTKEQEKEATKFRRLLRIGLLIVVVAMAGLLGMAIAGILSVAVAIIVIAAILIVSSISSFRRFINFARSQAQMEFERQKQIDAYWIAFTRAYDASTALTRFCALYWQYLDWAKTVAYLIREPWGRVGEPGIDGALESAPHPLSMIIARATMSGDQFQRSVAAAQQEVIIHGWLRDAFDWQVKASGDRYRMLMNIPDDVDSDPTHDASPPGTVAGVHAASGDEILSPRGQVAADAQDGRFGGSARARQGGEVVATTLRRALNDLFSDVEVPPPAGRGKTGDNLMEFLALIVPSGNVRPCSFPGSIFIVEELHEPARIEVTLPADVSPKGDPDESVSRVEGRWWAKYRHPFIMGAHRVDVSAVYSANELRVVESGQATAGMDEAPPPSDGSAAGVIP
jgi:hypothetical protein